jgi:hypothetical protein
LNPDKTIALFVTKNTKYERRSTCYKTATRSGLTTHGYIISVT